MQSALLKGPFKLRRELAFGVEFSPLCVRIPELKNKAFRMFVATENSIRCFSGFLVACLLKIIENLSPGLDSHLTSPFVLPVFLLL